jgi:hypothetical protein
MLPFFGKLLVLTANVRLDWKEIARYKPSNLFGLIVSSKGKKFYNIDPWRQCCTTFLSDEGATQWVWSREMTELNSIDLLHNVNCGLKIKG